MLTIHHLGRSQSERIVWLCEELGIPYELKRYERDPTTKLSPPEVLALHPLGAAPVIDDGDLRLAETGAIIEYILARYGEGQLVYGPDHPRFADYLYWFHFANATFQPVVGRSSLLRRAGTSPDNPANAFVRERSDRVLRFLEDRLASEPYLAGPDLTAADITLVFSLTTMRLFAPFDLGPYPAIRAYLARTGKREAYRRTMAKAEPGFEPMLA